MDSILNISFSGFFCGFLGALTVGIHIDPSPEDIQSLHWTALWSCESAFLFWQAFLEGSLLEDPHTYRPVLPYLTQAVKQLEDWVNEAGEGLLYETSPDSRPPSQVLYYENNIVASGTFT
ncbi:hypothetical protein CISG_06263 [Coccidioides immitis RMSCC 3703]|uniref:Uncharacterized protein n=2 Tax=Coccidioides immitis TaxID=5501 RepID=A0A0J8QVY9_COCIT|nr:hypothetical protein CIRG_06422 [Coccidioides immitis RMSCC 2394]KMU77029.1 hypothetical protein CISG_06263 [Coccidioides immitis RMSCC 3703]